MNRAARGQSMLETLIMMPLLVFLLLGVVQLLWLFLTHQMVQSAAIHVTRQASLDGGDLVRKMATIEKKMRPLPGKAAHVPLVIRLHPTDAQILQYGEQINRHGQRYYRLTTDFTLVRMDNLPGDMREHWLRSRIVQYEIVWCQPLKVPVAAPIMAYFLRYTLDDKQQYCNLQAVGRAPMKAVTSRAAAPLIAPLEFHHRELTSD